MPVSPYSKFRSTTAAVMTASLLLLQSGCGSRGSAGGAAAPQEPVGPWFCEPAMDGDGWDCTDDPSRVANPRPSQPLATALAARAAAEAAATADSALTTESLDTGNDSLMTAPSGIDEPIDSVTPDQPARAPSGEQPDPVGTVPQTPAATATGTPEAEPTATGSTAADAELPDYARLAYRPEQPTSLLDLPPDFYAVQVIALNSVEELQRFFEQLGVSELTAAEVEVDGNLRYVLLLGVYETFAAAEQAAENPPASLKDYDPWIRRLGGLQAAMLRADRRRP